MNSDRLPFFCIVSAGLFSLQKEAKILPAPFHVITHSMHTLSLKSENKYA